MKAARSAGLGPGTFLISILLTGLSTNLESRTPDTLTVRGAALQSLSEGEWVRFTSEPDGRRGGQGPGARRNGARAGHRAATAASTRDQHRHPMDQGQGHGHRRPHRRAAWRRSLGTASGPRVPHSRFLAWSTNTSYPSASRIRAAHAAQGTPAARGAVDRPIERTQGGGVDGADFRQVVTGVHRPAGPGVGARLPCERNLPRLIHRLGCPTHGPVAPRPEHIEATHADTEARLHRGSTGEAGS